MAIKLFHITNDYIQSSPFCRLQLVVETFGQLTYWANQFNKKSPKLLSQRIGKRYYKTWGLV